MPGILLVRTDSDDDVWEDVLWRMGELPGMRRSDQGDAAEAVARASISRRLIVAEDPAWRGATSEDVSVLIADATTMREPGQRVLVIPLEDQIGFSFRVDPEVVGGMVANLALRNMDIRDWRDDEA